VPARPTAKPVNLTRKQRAELERTTRSATAPYRAVLRARIILLAADGVSNEEISRRLLASIRSAGPLKKRLLQVLLKDPEVMLYHAEVVYRDGEPVGYVRAASYGHTLGGAVGLVMAESSGAIDQAWIDAGRWEVDVADPLVPAVASLRPLYDPEMKKIKS
jgi:glycine cleavage system aminomethyltransferase T